MRRRSRPGLKPAKARRRKAATPKRRTARKAARSHNYSVAALRKQMALLTHERDAALERQNATGEILASITGSTTDLSPVFEAIVRNLLRLFGTRFAIVTLVRDGMLVLAGFEGAPGFEKFAEHFPVPLDEQTVAGKAILAGRAIQLTPVIGNPESPPFAERSARKFGFNSQLAAPIIRDGRVIGAIVTAHRDAVPFTDKQLALIKSFAAQAVIAIENTRLLSELRQSLEQQTATAEVLSVISASPGELEPVFQAMLENATRICEAKFGTLLRFDGKAFHLAAGVGIPPALAEFHRQHQTFQPVPNSPLDRAMRTMRVSHTADDAAEAQPSPPARLAGARSVVCVPMLKDDAVNGAIVIYRQEVRPFTDKQIELLANFAAQAVIAIENTRLLNELRQSLEQQTATADVLRVISSSPGELEPVFQAMLENATRICEAKFGILTLQEGSGWRIGATHNTPPAFTELRQREPVFRPGPLTALARVAASKQLLHIFDAAEDLSYQQRDPSAVVFVELAGVRTVLIVPMLKDEELIGTIAIYRQEVHPFTDKQIELVTNFAAQAVIAIENTRLLNELRQRTDDLTESLEQQTATSEVLRVISSSPGELEPVFQAMLENAVRICDAKFGTLYRFDGKKYQMAASFGTPPEFDEFQRRRGPFEPTPGIILDQVMRTKRVSHCADVAAEPVNAATARLGGARSIVGVPMLKDDALIGAIVIYRQEVRPFTDKQIELVQNFAAQAVIAIENTRLLNELRQRTNDLTESLEQQTATSEVLRVISSSPGELDPVFQTMLANAVRICDAKFGVMYRSENETFDPVALFGTPPALVEFLQQRGAFRPDAGTGLDHLLRTRDVVRIVDESTGPAFRAAAKFGGARSLVAVPMLKEGELIGVIIIYRQEVRPFTDKQVELVQNFAAQAVIAIENTRLLTELRQRTTDLTESLETLRTAQDRLVQTEKLASLGQLTAGIAHEIKNPLNFVNNFSAVSVELIDELREALAGAHLDGKLRGEINEIADMLQGNLDKVVQHGKRANSIVKNMLLHSRQGSGEHRPVDINALVEESLNLAYHGARAEKQGFNITLEKSFDPAAGEVDLFPQEITRVLLNLISNGFYAATKRKAEANGGDFEPTLAAATKNLGDSVEIRIRDNGAGIPAAVKDKMFNPFFTTKPAGEGTGLGLSISHDIIVKQHSGSIEVDTQPGAFTEFRIVLPRAGTSLSKSGEIA